MQRSPVFKLFLALALTFCVNNIQAFGEQAGNLPSSQAAEAVQVDQQVASHAQVWQKANYQSQGENKPVRVFGEQVFRGGFSGVRADGLNSLYKILPGDQVVVRAWGSVEIDRVLPVDAQGNIFIPTIGPVAVQGITHSELNQRVRSAINQIYTSGVQVYTQLQGVQPISVFVTGFVNNPGQYAGTPTDSLIYFLNQANGIKGNVGSYRAINVLRQQDTIARFDIYQFITQGKAPPIQFEEGDTIVVEQRGSMVTVLDEQEFQTTYELGKNESSGKDLFSYVVLPGGTSHVLVKGYNPQGPFFKYLSLAEFGNRDLRDGDTLIFRKDQTQDTMLIQLEGSYLGSSFFVVPKNTKLTELLANVEVDPNLTATQNVSIKRKSVAERQQQSLKSSLQRLEQTYLTATSSTAEEANIRVKEAELIKGFVEKASQVKPNGRLVVAGGQSLTNVRLQDGDVITLPQRSESVLVSGQVLVPTSLVYQEDWRLQDYIEKAGGFTDQADDEKIVVIRQSGEVVTNAGANVQPGDEVLVLPEVPTKNIQLATSVSQILYQIAIAAKVAFDL